MSSNLGLVLVAAPATLHRQGLLTTLHEAGPGLTICLLADAGLLLTLLQQRTYALLILDEAVATIPLRLLLEQLYAVRSQQQVLCFSSAASRHSWPPQLYPRPLTLLAHDAAPAEVGRTIRQLLATAAHGSWSGKPGVSGPPTPFSRRELEVLRLVVDDYCNQEIANQLCLSVRTVESHRRTLLQKAGARTLIGLAVQAVRAGWVEPV